MTLPRYPRAITFIATVVLILSGVWLMVNIASAHEEVAQVSVLANETQGNEPTFIPTMSSQGQFIAVSFLEAPEPNSKQSFTTTTHSAYIPLVVKDGDTPGCAHPLTSLTVSGALTGAIDTPYTFAVNHSPADATLPITLTWSPEPTSGQGTASASYQWSMAGSQTVNVQALNCGGEANASHTIAIDAPVCPRPLTSVTISGAATGIIDTPYTFAVSPSPADATLPITATWSPEPTSGQGTTSAAYQWSTAGSQTVNVQVRNCGGPVSASHTIAVQESPSGIPVASVLTPFDANLSDLPDPSDWQSRYGKRPEIIVASDGVALDVLAQDYDAGTNWDAVLLHIEPNATGYEVTQALTGIPMLDRVMGLAIDSAGYRYYATGVDEDSIVDSTYPPLDTYRSNIVRVLKLNAAGDVRFDIDLDTARHEHDNGAEMIINPMVASTSRLAVGANEIALVHGINTDPDWKIGGRRHQKALSTRLDATNGEVTRTGSIWVSHSFDQRLLFDGTGIVEHHLGDAYPRTIVFGREHNSYPLFHIKGNLGENNTFTRLGNLALIENDPDFGYLALFVTEKSVDTGETINGPRNLAIVRVKGTDNSIDPGLPDTLTVTSSGVQKTNRLRWLTQYATSSNLHAERPKLIGIGNDQYIALWEEWLDDGTSPGTYNGVFGMVIDDNGNIVRPATLITNTHHLHRGDDAFLLDGRAAWMTGNAAAQKLHLHFVDSKLNYEMFTLD